MSAVTGKLKKFFNFYENVLVLIRKITHRIPIWVINKLEYNLILGRTYHKIVRLKLKKVNNGLYRATIYTLNKTGIIS